jgi:IS30 family transposase
MQDTCQSTISTRKRKSKITPEIRQKVIELSEKNLTTREVETLTTVDHSTVAKILQRYGLEKQNIDDYIAQRPQILAGLQTKILQSIDEDDLKTASLLQRVTAYGVLYDKERLETGKSTQNVQGIYHIVSEIERSERKQKGVLRSERKKSERKKIERSERKKVVSDSDIEGTSGNMDTTGDSNMGVDSDAS